MPTIALFKSSYRLQRCAYSANTDDVTRYPFRSKSMAIFPCAIHTLDHLNEKRSGSIRDYLHMCRYIPSLEQKYSNVSSFLTVDVTYATVLGQ